MRLLGDNCITNHTVENRYELSKCREEYTRYLKIQLYQNRRKRLTLSKIMNVPEQWIEGNEPIANAYCVLFSEYVYSREAVKQL
ncbi:hypothetical protein H5410_015891 [Solanum commersonii]|uniref:Transposase n=1 Tax=Solanum commersonii TaxID=4109 RepID=A0A9J5ZVF0_SOLCO|nr:hypothetical protein H5410_015891 [Solanum commersonii]